MIEKIKMFGKSLKESIIIYFKEVKSKLVYFKNNYKDIFKSVKENFSKREYQKKYVTILVLLVCINLLVINLLMTFAYYSDDDSIPIIQAAVGDFSTGDYTLLVYIEEANSSGKGTGEYRLTYGIPSEGYTYKRYECKNSSTLTYNNVTKTTSATITKPEVCSIYFDLNGTLDLSVKVMLEETKGSNKYVVTNDIPTTGYTYSHYECANGGTVTYNSSTHNFTLSSDKKEYCTAYFKKDN